MANTIGSHIRSIRKSKGLNLKGLSEKSGLSIPYISDIERDVVNPSLKTLQAIAKALDLSLPEIVDYNNELEHRLIQDNMRLREMLKSIHSLLSQTE